MALADKKPFNLPVSSGHASAALTPMKTTIHDLKGKYSENHVVESPKPKHRHSSIPTDEYSEDQDIENGKPVKEEDGLSPTSRSISPDSLMQSGSSTSTSTKKSLVSSSSSRDSTPSVSLAVGFPKPGAVLKKTKVPSRVPIATGFSTTIPVTGEKPKPQQEGDASLEDDVLYAIFLILYEKDPLGAGMTVKQICDVLMERHPQMAQLLSKTSNLVSAKLNAYVKRVEKGDAQLKYALSREWADASPKRMVYVYRGLLTKDFHVHVKKNNLTSPASLSGNASFASGTSSVADRPKLACGAGAHGGGSSSPSPSFPADSLEAAKHSALAKPRRLTMFDLGISRPAFVESPLDKSNLFVPYLSAPVAATLNGIKHKSGEKPESGDIDADVDADISAETATLDPTGKKNDEFDFDDLEVFNEDDDDIDDFIVDSFPNKNGKRSKSMSYLSVNKKSKVMTAAAAAPRVPKAPCSHSPTAAAAAAALHAAALKAIAAAAPSRSNSRKLSTLAGAGDVPHRDWGHMVRAGFLTEDIRAPEDISLSDLDKLFG